MLAAKLIKPGKFEIEKVRKPEPFSDQVRINVEGCGICASSIPLWEGRSWFSYPVQAGAPGHEGWGIVDAVGENVENVAIGDRVAFLSGNAFAEYDIATGHSVIKLPADLGMRHFPAEPLGCAMNIFDRSDIHKDLTVAIIGMGFLGLLLCQLAKSLGARVIAISKRDFSLDCALRYGADEVLSFTETHAVANLVSELTDGAFCSRVIESTGKQQALDLATEVIAEGGKLVIAGYHQDGLRQVDFQKWNWKGIDVINAHERKAERYKKGMQQAVEAVRNGIIHPERLYTHVFDLNTVGRGFRMAAARPDGFIKALVEI